MANTEPSATPTSAPSASPKLVKKPSISEARPTTGSENSAHGCDHIKDLLDNAQSAALKQYTRLMQVVHKNPGLSTRVTKAIGSSSITPTFVRPTYLCLQCPSTGNAEQRDKHEKGHRFCVESSAGNVYCRECRDFVYEPALEEIRAQQGKKRKYSAFMSDVDSKILAANSTPTPCRASGLRGLYNMGQTCFMSVVLQSLIHNPFIRSYYLGEGHKSGDCEREACTSCALDDIFTEFHSTEKAEGYGMVSMLQASWRGGGSLAGYQQQDAHEYLQFILNSLHSANIDPDEKEEKAEDCPCIVHRTFGGLLRSTVTCSKCKNTTTALDPFVDLSLDVRKDGLKKKKLQGDDKKATITLAPPAPQNMQLTECFDRFTSAETLPAAEYTCRACSSQQTATKRLSLSRLPPVLPIHLKRFSHSKSATTSVKLSTKVRFPSKLDLSPYASSANNTVGAGSKKKDKANGVNGASSSSPVRPSPSKDKDKDKEKDKDKDKDEDTEPRPVYDLSSVIVHKGKMDNGHYISYSRVADEWFMFDDSKVVLVEEGDVLASEAYMLFYVIAAL